MTGELCEQVREDAPELALGLLGGEERASALQHLAACEACRAHVRALADAADELLELAPRSEPPVGFEDRVFEALANEAAPATPGHQIARARPPRRRLQLALAVAAVGLAAGGVWLAGSSDRDLAGEYRDVLAVANGSYFEANHLEAPGGRKVGYAYGYEGKTSWVLAVLYDLPDGRYRLVGVGPDGERSAIVTVEVAGGRGTAGGALEGAFGDVSEVRLLDERGREVADAELGGS
jgi:hypothetical protein